MLFTPEELPALKLHAAIEQESGPADAWAQKHFGDAYAGSFLLGDRLHVQCACDVTDAREAARADGSIAPVVTDNVQFDQVRYSLKDLSAVLDEVNAFLRETNAVSNGAGTATEYNVVQVLTGPSSTPGLATEIEARFVGAPVKVINQDSDVQPNVNKNDGLIFGLVEGGLALDEVDWPNLYPYDCTSAFAVQSPVYGPFILTAGHCSAINGDWWQGGSRVGYTSARNFGGYFDAESISTYGWRNNYGHFHWNAYYYGEAVNFVKSAGEVVGLSICQTGQATTGMDGYATACGTTSMNNYTPPYGDSPMQPVFLWSTYPNTGGDSGAAVVWPTALYGWGGVGVHSGGDGVHGVDSRLDTILYIWNLQLTAP